MQFNVGMVMLGLILTLPAGAEVTVLTGGTIIDGNGGAPISGGVIVITDQKITAVGPARLWLMCNLCDALH